MTRLEINKLIKRSRVGNLVIDESLNKLFAGLLSRYMDVYLENGYNDEIDEFAIELYEWVDNELEPRD